MGDQNAQGTRTVLQHVRNRNNMADMYLSRQMDHFKRQLALRVVSIDMERLDWQTFLCDLPKCNSDDLAEFVPLLIDELGEDEYTGRVRNLKTRFQDIFQAFELGLTERIPMDYHKIKEDGQRARKDYHLAKSELRKRIPRNTTSHETERSKVTGVCHNPQKMAEAPHTSEVWSKNEKFTGFITRLTMPLATDHTVGPNRSHPLSVAKERQGQGSNQNEVPAGRLRLGASKPLFPRLVLAKKTENTPGQPAPQNTGDESDVDSDSRLDSDDCNSEDKKVDRAMRKMADKNAKRLRTFRRSQKASPSLGARISEFLQRLEELRIPEKSKSSNLYLPSVTAY